MKNYFRKLLGPRTLSVLGTVAVLAGAYLAYMAEQGNFHAITPDVAYRSAQLDRDELEHYIRKYDIRTVLNLRGSHPGKEWYDEELRTCRNLDVEHCDIGLSAVETPSEGDVRQLLHFMTHAPRPVLIHCQGGADRSGLAAALWKVVVDGISPEKAREQLSIRYGHLPLGPTQAMDRFFEAWIRDHAAANLGDTSREVLLCGRVGHVDTF